MRRRERCSHCRDDLYVAQIVQPSIQPHTYVRSDVIIRPSFFQQYCVSVSLDRVRSVCVVVVCVCTYVTIITVALLLFVCLFVCVLFT